MLKDEPIIWFATQKKNRPHDRLKGYRPDFVDFLNHIIYELKPYNPRGVRNGIKQLERYKRLFELKTGATWDTFIDFY